VKTKLISNLLSHMSTTSSRLLSYRIFRTLPVATVVSLYVLLKFQTIRERHVEFRVIVDLAFALFHSSHGYNLWDIVIANRNIYI